MKLNNEDKRVLLNWGYDEDDFHQIEKASVKTVITFRQPDGSEQNISTEQAISLMGRNNYLSRLARAAFHLTSYGEVDGKGSVFFDASKLFKDQ